MFRETHLPAHVPGRLLLHSMPGRYESLDEVWAAVKLEEVSVIVRLADLQEASKKAPSYAVAIHEGTVPTAVLACEIPDYGVPADRQSFWSLAQDVADRLRAGQVVLVHCGAGIGRTGTFAIAVLLALGQTETAARRVVGASGAAPETSGQRELIDWCVSQVGVEQVAPADRSASPRGG